MRRRSELVRVAKQLGWSVAGLTGSGHVRLVKPGCQSVIIAATPSDRRARLNALAELRRAEASAHGAAARPAAAAMTSRAGRVIVSEAST